MSKSMTIANFNITFGKEQRPLLEYFDEIIYPALNSSIIREYDDTDYFIDKLELVEIEPNEYLLIGQYIKNTVVKIKSKYSRKEGLISAKEEHDTAPYSIFIIFLKNHRAVLVKNQKESPDIRSFNSTIRHILKEYIRNTNKELPKEKRLPYAMVDIVNLPSKKSIEEKLKNVKKIKKLILKFHPLNGDVPVADLFDKLIEEVDNIGGTRSRLEINSPTKRQNLINMLSETRGTVDPELSVIYDNGGKGKLNNDSFSEVIDIDLADDVRYEQALPVLIQFSRSLDAVNEVSNENRIIYDGILHKLNKYKNKE